MRDEVALARELGLDVLLPGKGNFGFRQPCPHHLSGRCAIYHRRRPTMCHRYKCRLLRRYEQGDATLEESMRPIQKAKELIELFETQSGAGQGFRAELGRILNAPDTLLAIDANARSGMIAAALFVLYRRHFEEKIEPLDPHELDASSDHSASAI
ncbi:MAG: hypothetical protein WBO09_16905 [Methylocystis silviterrae]|uniref:hypothetical protein n=1 Tax=Methylocystis silviterrae TaxID=2743612 RepID=UPI003C752EE4